MGQESFSEPSAYIEMIAWHDYVLNRTVSSLSPKFARQKLAAREHGDIIVTMIKLMLPLRYRVLPKTNVAQNIAPNATAAIIAS
jgi:hypothetical protein